MEQILTPPKPPMSIYSWLKFIGLGSFTLKNNKFYPAPFPDKLYPLTLAFSYLLLVSMPFFTGKEIVPSDDTSSPFARTNGVLYYAPNCSVTFATLVAFFLTSNEAISIMNKLCVMDNDFKSFGIDEDLEKRFKNIFVTSLTANIVVGTMCLVAIFLDPFGSIHVSIAYMIQECIRLNILLIFSHVLLCIGNRFELLNTRFYTVFKLAHNLESTSESTTVSGIKINSEDQQNRGNIMRKLEVSHLELCKLVDRIKQPFAIPIFLNSISLFFELVRSCRWISLIILNPSHDDDARYAIFCPLVRMTIVIVQSCFIAYATATICEKGNAIKCLLFKVWNKFSPTESTHEFVMFSLQLLHRSVTVSFLGFFDLGYSYLLKMFCGMMGYLIIAIQLDTSRKNSSGA